MLKEGQGGGKNLGAHVNLETIVSRRWIRHGGTAEPKDHIVFCSVFWVLLFENGYSGNWWLLMTLQWKV